MDDKHRDGKWQAETEARGVFLKREFGEEECGMFGPRPLKNTVQFLTNVTQRYKQALCFPVGVKIIIDLLSFWNLRVGRCSFFRLTGLSNGM